MHASNPMFSDRDSDRAITHHYVFRPEVEIRKANAAAINGERAGQKPRLLAPGPGGPAGPGGPGGGRPDGPLMTMKEVIQMTSLSRGTIYNRLEEEESKFPKPVKVGSRSIRFRRSEIEAWITSLPVSDRSMAERDV